MISNKQYGVMLKNNTDLSLIVPFDSIELSLERSGKIFQIMLRHLPTLKFHSIC